MANRIFTNGEEGKILTSVGNRIIKQPYEFGNAFKGTSPYYINISVPSIDYESFTLAQSINNPSDNNYVVELFLNGVSSHSIKKQSTSHYWVGSSSVNANSPLIVPGLAGLSNLTFDLITIGSDKSSKTLTFSSGVNIRNTVYTVGGGFDLYVASKTLTQIKLGTYGLYTHQNLKTNRITLFNRQITNGEIMYAYGNGLGNDFQSLFGVVIDIQCIIAEVLDFSTIQDGSDMRAGVRDYSGFNRHGEIMNLPAGTPQQKVDYANANLFVPFI